MIANFLITNTIGFPPLLTIMLFLPATGGLFALAMARGENSASSERVWTAPKLVAMATTLATFLISLYFLLSFQIPGTRLKSVVLPQESVTSRIPHWPVQFVEHGTWFPSLGISYFLGLDGINVWLMMLTTTVMTLAVFAACFMIRRRSATFLMLMLIAETGMLGVFLSWNLFLFYIFWEVMLVPAYFLVGMWGESRRVYATTKFVIYTIFGSFLMLVAIFYLYATSPQHSLDIPVLIQHPPSNGAQTWLFLAFMLALGIKASLFPFHSWAPDVYTEAPIPATVLIASVMGKTATFSMIRFVLPIFPHAANQLSGLISILAIVGILYGATMALVQVDIKRTLAFASISHMNIIVLGIFALNQEGFDGSILQMMNHAVIMAGLFFVVAMVYARTGTRRLDEMSGIAKAYPVLAGFGLLLFLAAMDLPGLGSFAGEFTILVGVFIRNAWFATVAAVVTIMAAWYTVRWFQGIFHGPAGESAPPVAQPATSVDDSTVYEYPVRQPPIALDLRPREMALLLPIAAIIIWLGVLPRPVTNLSTPTTSALSSALSTVSGSASSAIRHYPGVTKP